MTDEKTDSTDSPVADAKEAFLDAVKKPTVRQPEPRPAESKIVLDGYRKLLTMAIALIAVVVLAIAAPEQLDKALDGIVWIVGAFMGGSVGEHIARALKR